MTATIDRIEGSEWMGTWEDWVPVYNQLPVYTRMALSHLHGRHDDTENPYEHCVLCKAEGRNARQVEQNTCVDCGQGKWADIHNAEHPEFCIYVPPATTDRPQHHVYCQTYTDGSCTCVGPT